MNRLKRNTFINLLKFLVLSLKKFRTVEMNFIEEWKSLQSSCQYEGLDIASPIAEYDRALIWKSNVDIVMKNWTKAKKELAQEMNQPYNI